VSGALVGSAHGQKRRLRTLLVVHCTATLLSWQDAEKRNRKSAVME
jgi:hypothetical protein